MALSPGMPADAWVLDVPSFDPKVERIASPPDSARGLVALRWAQEAMKAARAEAEEARERLAMMEDLHACRLVSHELAEAADRDEEARARMFDAEFVLALATMEAFAATNHVKRIAIRACD